MDNTAIANALKSVEKDHVLLVELQFVDIFGIVKSVTIPTERLEDVFSHGQTFDGSSIEGFARIQESDLVLAPDPDTYALLPWRPRDRAECRFMCDVITPQGGPYPAAPRHILKKVLAEAEKMGFIYCVGTEQEFDLFPREMLEHTELLAKTTEGHLNYYFDFTSGSGEAVRREIILALHEMGMAVETSHHEVAPKQHEIDIRYADALRHADDAVTLRYVVKAVAAQHGFHATFMPKTREGVNGVGMHTNQSLLGRESRENVFYQPGGEYGLSETARHFIAGQLRRIREICAVTNPLVNSYKRIVPGYEAPCYVSWGQMNRSALMRVPAVPPGKNESTRVELRSPDPSCNPYLSFALLLAAGLEGIREKLAPPAPTEEDIFEPDLRAKHPPEMALPATLGHALEAFEQSDLARRVLGEHVFQCYLAGKRREWDEFRTTVTDWELRKYLKLY